MDDYGSRGFEPTGDNVVRTGKVIARRLTNAGAQVQVSYPDRGVTSDWIPVGQSGAKGQVFYSPPPQVGDNVTVLHFPTGIERGVVVCANNTPNNPCFSPRSIDAVAYQGLDGSYFEYDPTSGVGCLSINGIQTVFLNAAGQVKFIIGGDFDATVSGNLNATVTGNVEVTCTDLDATASGEATVTAPTIALKGNTTITGTLTVSGNVTFQSGGTIATHLTNNDGSGGGS